MTNIIVKKKNSVSGNAVWKYREHTANMIYNEDLMMWVKA